MEARSPSPPPVPDDDSQQQPAAGANGSQSLFGSDDLLLGGDAEMAPLGAAASSSTPLLQSSHPGGSSSGGGGGGLFGSPVLAPFSPALSGGSGGGGGGRRLRANSGAGGSMDDDADGLPNLSLDPQAFTDTSSGGGLMSPELGSSGAHGPSSLELPSSSVLQQLQSPLFPSLPLPSTAADSLFHLPASASALPAIAASPSSASSTRPSRPREIPLDLGGDDEAGFEDDARGRKKQRRSSTHPALTGGGGASSSSSSSAMPAAAAAAASQEEEEEEESGSEEESDEEESESEEEEEEEEDGAAATKGAAAAASSSSSSSRVPRESVDLLDDDGDGSNGQSGGLFAPSSSSSNQGLSFQLGDESAPLSGSVIDLTDDNSPYAPTQQQLQQQAMFNPFAAASAIPAAAAASSSAPNKPQSIASSLFGSSKASSSALPASNFNPFANLGAGGPKKAPAAAAAAAALTGPTPPPTQSVDLRQNSDDDELSDNKLGTVLCLVFGMKMCPGKAAIKETVVLQRIRTGADGNAIRVDNVIQQPCGVLNKDTAAALAPLIDQKLVRVEAKVGTLTEQEMGLRIDLYGKTKDRRTVEKHLRRFPMVNYLSLLDPQIKRGVVPTLGAQTAGHAGLDGFLQQHGSSSSAAAAAGQPTHVNEFGEVVPGYAPIGAGMSVREIENDLDSLFGAEIDLALMPLAETPACLRTHLHPYQRQGLAWMVQHEQQRVMNVEGKSELMMGWTKQTSTTGKISYYNKLTKESQAEPPELARGGLLADEMGLGKTLTVLALIGSSLKSNLGPDGSSSSNKLTLSLKRGSLANKRAVAPTLIVCPLSVITNWEQQVLHHFNPAQCLTYYTYHGPNRIRDVAQLRQYDILITTYNILSQEYDVSQAALGVNESSSSESDDDAFKVFRKKRVTKTPKVPKKPKGQSAGAIAAAAALAAANEQEAEFGTPSTVKKAAPLFEIDFFRIVLDEAHVIRERNTLQSRAARALKGERRWALSGTPLVNKVDDAFALLNFIRVPPFTSHQMWQRIIAKPMKNRDPKGMERLQQVMSTICLRRKKNEEINGKRILILPDKFQRTRFITLSGKEKGLYDTLAESGRSQFNRLLQSDSVLKHYAFVLEILLRMRQACDHSMLVPQHYHSSGFSALASTDDRKAELHRLVSLLEDGMADECGMCRKSPDDVVITPCCHYFCKKCLDAYLEQPAYHNAIYMQQFLQPGQPAPPSNSTLYCPQCRAQMDKSLIVGMRHRELLRLEEEQKQAALLHSQGHITLSPKLLALLEELQLVLNRGDKAIVFSQWTTFLDILQACLNQANVKHVRLDGQMSSANRAKALKSFEDDTSVKVFLISLKAGGVGLNLTSANHVFMMDPWWNPSTEDQAVDRVHRLGQTKPVEVVRFICKDSVEEKILDLQNAKREMTTTALTRASKSREDQQADRLQDLLHLFK